MKLQTSKNICKFLLTFSQKYYSKRRPTMTTSPFRSDSLLHSASLAPLKQEEEHELAVKMANGDKKARETLIRSNLRFAIREAKKYWYSNLDYEDLLSTATTGLTNAVNHFNPEKNTKIITYASWWIRSEFKNACEKKAKEKEYGVSEVASSEAIETILSNKPDTESMSPEESAIMSCFKDAFYKCLRKLADDERKIFLLHRGLCGHSKHSFTEIAKLYGKTKQWAWLKARSVEKFLATELADWAA